MSVSNCRIEGERVGRTVGKEEDLLANGRAGEGVLGVGDGGVSGLLTYG